MPGSLQKVYYDATSTSDALEFRKLFDARTVGEAVIAGRQVEIWGRKLAVPESSASAAWFDFDALCGRNLGAADYIEVTKSFKTIFVDAVPRMDLDTKDRVRLAERTRCLTRLAADAALLPPQQRALPPQARRFITFIDACYESRVRAADPCAARARALPPC